MVHVEPSQPAQPQQQSILAPERAANCAAATAIAGHCLGMQSMYLDTGSGADQTVPADMIAAVRRAVPCPVIVGGGLRTPDAVMDAWAAGADLAVVGSAIERDPDFLRAFATSASAPTSAGPGFCLY